MSVHYRAKVKYLQDPFILTFGYGSVLRFFNGRIIHEIRADFILPEHGRYFESFGKMADLIIADVDVATSG
jgi:hypothetical protein